MDHGHKRLVLIGVLALAGALMPAVASAASILPSGIVLEEVPPGTASRRAGLMPGDELLAWRREPALPAELPAAGELATPFDLVEVFLEQVPRNPITLEGRRGTAAMSWVLPQGAPSDPQGVRAVPLLPGNLLDVYRRGRAQLEAADFAAGVAAMRSAAAGARTDGAADLAAWFLAEAARELAAGYRWGEADSLYNEALSPDLPAQGFITGQLFREWGGLFQKRFAWDRAEECYERALAADRQRPFETLAQAWSLVGLGFTDDLSGGPKNYDDLFREAMEIRHRLAPGSSDDALSWLQWGQAAALDDEWGKAVERYQIAVRMLEKSAASRLLLADGVAFLAFAHAQRGEVEASRQSWLRAEALVGEAAPEEFPMIAITQGLGLIASRKGELRQAEDLLARSLGLARRLVPGSLTEASALRELGLVQLQAGKVDAAAQHLCQAVDLVTDWRQKFQSNEEMRSRWGLFFADHHRDCAESLVQTGRAEEAFLVLEKGRARAFLDLRAERGVRLAALPPERSREWQKLNAEYDRTQEELDVAGARQETGLAQIVNLEGRLREIRRKKERLLERELAPGAVRYPEPLSLAAARRGLEPGTALLFYSVGRTKTLLFVLSPEGAGAPGWAVLPLAAGSAELRKKVGLFRETLIEDRLDRRAPRAQARALYDLLVRPAERHLGSAERIVIAPDGPLHTLPFAALRRGAGGNGGDAGDAGDSYLIEWKPLHFTLSATVYAAHQDHRPPPERSAPQAAKLVAFGNPLYSSTGPEEARPSPDPFLAEVLRKGVAPLPESRKEVEEIARLFAGARVVTGDQVTEETVKEAAGGASYLHFAVHGLFNERNPLNSALVLSPSRKAGQEKKNGLLQAWEVMESLPLDADLVTLSACDTALGREIGGEGLIGLTRAFQYAGARSVVATLWGISDRSTAGFMAELYGALRAGKPKDEALRAAQLAQIRSPKPQPFYWAAFQLFGDWR